MATLEVTLHLPEPVYDQLRRAAERSRRSVADLLVEAAIAAAPALDTEAGSLGTALAQMAYLNDAALWQAARATLAPEQQARLEALHDRKQREGLTDAEREEEQALLALYRETLLVRAQAAVLLKQRGYDIADPEQFAPLG
jgi:hypothetical protein